MIKRITHIILIVMIMDSCINMTDPIEQARFIECRNSFDTALVRYIPKKIPNNSIGMGESSLSNLNGRDNYSNYAGMYLTVRFQNKKEYSDLKEGYSKQALFQRDLNDSCLLIIQTDNKQKQNKYSNNCKTTIPIPDYVISGFDDPSQQNKNYKLLVFDFKYMDILKRVDLKLRKDLPVEFSSGYSTGLTLNDYDMTINYWLIVW